MKNNIFPIGQLSEDAIEACHKIVRYAREHSTRKTSRIATNEDLLHVLLLSSDPFLTNMRHTQEKPKKELSEEAKSLLYCFHENNFDTETESDEGSDLEFL